MLTPRRGRPPQSNLFTIAFTCDGKEILSCACPSSYSQLLEAH